MSARDNVLGRIRRSLGVTGEEPARNAAVDNRLRRAPAGPIPALSQLPAARLALLIERLERNAATVARISAIADLPGAVANYLRAENLPAIIRTGEDRRIAALDWRGAQIEPKTGPADEGDAVGLAHALAAIAETGTVVLVSGRDSPTTNNFLPETHIAVVDAGSVVGDSESAWKAVRARYGRGTMPRTVNWISGPSRSSDIQQTPFLGAHGPRRLHVIIVGEPAA